MSDFIPHLFISVGETGAMFTLRETYLHTYISYGRMCKEVRSFHHKNLGQTPEEAYKKAKEFADSNGLPLNSSVENLKEELRKITRERAERQRKAIEEEQRIQAERDQKVHDFLSAGLIPFGMNYGRHFKKVEVTYLQWLVRDIDSFEEGSTIKKTALRMLYYDIRY